MIMPWNSHLKEFVKVVDSLREEIRTYLREYPYLFEKLDTDRLMRDYAVFRIIKTKLDKNLPMSDETECNFDMELTYIQKDFMQTLEQIKKIQQWEQLKRKFINLITFWRRSLWQK